MLSPARTTITMEESQTDGRSSPTFTKPSSPYLRSTVEKSIQRHHAVVFGRKANCPLMGHLQNLMTNTHGIRFRGVKLYYLEDLPAGREIEKVLRILVGESIQNKNRSVECCYTVDRLPCYVFVSRKFLSYREIIDLFRGLDDPTKALCSRCIHHQFQSEEQLLLSVLLVCTATLKRRLP